MTNVNSVNSKIGIPDERAKEISKEYAKIIKPIYVSGQLTESKSIEIIRDMNLTDIERIWLAYHIGGMNRMIGWAKENAKKVVINF